MKFSLNCCNTMPGFLIQIAEVVAGTYTYGTDLLVDRKESVNALTILIGTHDRTVVIDAKGSHIR